MATTRSEAVQDLPYGAKWSCSFGNPGEGGYVEYYRAPNGDQWQVSNGPYHLCCWEFDWHAQKLEARP